MLTSVEKIKQYIGRADSDTQDDDLIFEMAKRAQSMMEHYCDRQFDAQVYVEHYVGDGSNKLIVRQYPVIAISGTVDGIELGIWDDVDYVFPASSKKASDSIVTSDQTPGLVQLKGDIFIDSKKWSFYNLENIKVAYQAGYVTPPDDLEITCTKIASVEFARAKGIISSIQWDKDPQKILDDAWEDLFAHRRVR